MRYKHGSRAGSASMSVLTDMALRRVGRRTREATSFQNSFQKKLEDLFHIYIMLAFIVRYIKL
ncbi:hypothetical protein SAMN05216302_10725 [Nitrosomonas aestuarii]|uniref:Uncharacterized protein n=1 Tax=Nitrosomonas aestuarii TaxID=52441 RepID=A0A1I4H6J0_9PROT|nr:hypothetical protein SAMN05216302_10725 [Nitrosomonas aestuarii]